MFSNKVLKNILGDRYSKNNSPLPFIDVAGHGPAEFVRTDVEDTNGKWKGDNLNVRNGYFVIHEGNKHHIYYRDPRTNKPSKVRMVKTPFGKSLADPSFGPLKYCRGCGLKANLYKGFCEVCWGRKEQGLSHKITFWHRKYEKQR